MNQKLFEKQLIELSLYFEKHLQNKMTLTKREHTDILNGVIFLLLKSSKDIDFAEFSAIYSPAAPSDVQGLKTILEKQISQVVKDDSIEYTSVIQLLRLSIHCFSNDFKMDINGEEWLKLASDFRVLEMERLSIH